MVKLLVNAIPPLPPPLWLSDFASSPSPSFLKAFVPSPPWSVIVCIFQTPPPRFGCWPGCEWALRDLQILNSICIWGSVVSENQMKFVFGLKTSVTLWRCVGKSPCNWPVVLRLSNFRWVLWICMYVRIPVLSPGSRPLPPVIEQCTLRVHCRLGVHCSQSLLT